jgi:hypothetical protein
MRRGGVTFRASRSFSGWRKDRVTVDGRMAGCESELRGTSE